MLKRNDKGRNPNEIGILSQGQAEIQGIQDELANELRMQQVQDSARLQTTGVMAQAAEGMLAMNQGNGPVLSQQVGNMNAGTQAIMQKYGVKPENSRKTTTQNIHTSSGGGTMNVRNEYTTNNHTDIKITQPQIPISQPQITTIQKDPRVDNTSKFKAWLNGMFAKQQNEAEIQKKEYRKKEWNLARNTTRLMKRIEDASKNMTARLDPQRMTSTLGGQLRWLLLLFGATMISKVWTPAMKLIANIEGGIRAAFGLPINTELRGNATKGLSIVDNIRAFIGIKPGEKTSLIEGLGAVIKEGVKKLIDKIDFWFEDRSIALKEIKFPEMKTPKINIPGMDTLLSGITDSLSGIGQYLGELITVALGGSKGRVQVAANNIRKQSISTFTNTQGKKVSMGDDELVKGRGRSYMRESDFGAGGILKGDASSTQAMSRTVTSLMNDKTSVAHTSEIASGVQQIFDVAKRQGKVVIDPEMLSTMGLSMVDINQLKQQKDLVQVPYKIIYVKPSEQDLRDADLHTSFNSTGAGWTGAAIGGLLGLVAGPLGIAAGAAGGGLVGHGIGEAIDDKINQARMERGLVAKLVPASSSEMSFDGSPGTPKMMFALTKKGADHVAAKFMAGSQNTSIDLTNREFYEKIRRIEERRKRQNGVQGPLRQNLNNNALREAQARYDAYETEYNRKFNADPNDLNNPYRHWDATTQNIGTSFNGMVNYVGEAMHGVATGLTGGRGKKFCTTSELNRRANYCMKFFMDRGLTKAQAAGIVGNLAKEGLMMRDLGQEIHDVNGPSAGIAMFHDVAGKHGHLSALKQFAQERGLNWKDLETQLLYLWEGSLNGKKYGQSVINQIRQLQGSDQDVAERASFIWGDKYEVFQGHSNWNHKSHQARRNASLGILKSDISNTAYTKYESVPSPTISLSGVGGTTTVPDSGIGQIAWIGDSQTCTAASGFPKGVASGLGTHVAYYGMVGANAKHYLGAKLKNQMSTNINALKNAGPAEALPYIIKNKPEYCIIALGHNGVGGLQNLINLLERAGIKVFTIKMWAIDGSRSRMATISPEQMSKLYNGIQSFGWVDLSWLDVEKGGDGVHASAQGCKKAAAETVNQLKKGQMSALEEDRAPVSDLGSWAAGVIETIASPLTGFGGGIDEGQLGNITDRMTPEQKAAFGRVVDQIKGERDFNRRTWEEVAGAKTDGIGTYIDYSDSLTGNTARVYLRTGENHNALDGIQEGDIDWIEVYGKNGKRVEGMSNEELEVLKRSVLFEKNIMFSDQPVEGGKGAGYNDYMTDPNGNFLFVPLGKFEDISGFSETAQKDFGGSIYYYICPSKSCNTVSVIQIRKVKASRLYGFTDEQLKDSDFDSSSYKYYGPIIYRKGETWKKWGTLPKDKVYTGGWQPICYFENVRLTPEATKEKDQLLKFMFEAKDLRHTNRGFERGDGSLLSKDELEFASKHNLVQRGFLGSGFTGLTSLMSQVGRQVNLNSKKIDTGSFDAIKKIYGDKKSREDYYNKHKDNFFTIDGILYEGGSKLKFGRVDESGKVSLFDDKEFQDIYDSDGGKAGLDNNRKLIATEQERILSRNAGLVSRDFSAEFIRDVSNYNRSAKVKGRETGIEALKGKFIIENEDGNKVEVPYKAYFFSNGTEKYYTVAGTYDGLAIPKLESNSISSLKSLTLKNVIGAKQRTRRHSTGALINDNEDIRNEERKQAFIRKLMNEGKTIVEKEEGSLGFYKLSDGSRVQFQYGNLTQEDIDRVNRASKYRQTQVKASEVIRMYEDSNLGKQHKSLIESANNDLSKVKIVNGYAVNEYGDIYGKAILNDDKTLKKVVPLSNYNDIQQAAVAPIDNNKYLREAFYDRAFNLQDMGYGSTRGNYKEVEVGGQKYYVKMNSDTDLTTLMDKGWTAASEGIYTLDGTGNLVNANISGSSDIFSSIDNKMKEMVEVQGLTNKAIDLLTNESVQAAVEAAEQRAEQEKAVIDQKLAVEKQEIYLKAGTEALEKLAEMDPTKTQGLINDAEEQAKNLKADVDKRTAATINQKKVETFDGNTWTSPTPGLQSREKGGFTGYSENNNEVVGVVHANEFVANARTTSKFRPLFEFLDKYQKVDLRENPIEIKSDPNASPNASPSYVNTGGNVINSGNTTIYNYGNGDGSAAGFNRNNSMSGSSANQLGYNSSVSGKNRFNGGH
jgi:hypothetical protein